MISFILEGALGVVLPLSQSAFFDAAVTTSILAPAVTLLLRARGAAPAGGLRHGAAAKTRGPLQA